MLLPILSQQLELCTATELPADSSQRQWPELYALLCNVCRLAVTELLVLPYSLVTVEFPEAMKSME